MVKIPTRLEDLLPPVALGKILDVLNQPALSNAFRDALNRVGIKDSSPVEQVQEAWQQARDWVGQLANRMVNPVHANPQLINATGELARPEWQGFPMASTVAEAYCVQAVNFYYTARLEESAQHAATKLLQTEDAMLTSSLAGAIQLVKMAFAKCAISRADTVRVPGFGDIGAMLQSGAGSVLEVGATNGATVEDWSRAITASDQVMILVSPNSLSLADAEQQRAAALQVANATGAAIVEILIDGVCVAAEADAALHFPVAQKHLQSGATAVILPLDGFISGPAGACLAGSTKLIKSCRNAAITQGLTLRGAALAAATTAFARASLATPLDTGVVDLVHTNVANLKDRAKRLLVQINDSEHVAAAEAVERINALGASPWNRYSSPSVALALTPRKDAATLLNVLQSGERGPAILCSIVGEKVLVDLKFVPPRDDHQIVKALNAMAPKGEPVTQASSTDASA